MRKLRGNGEKMRKWIENEEIATQRHLSRVSYDKHFEEIKRKWRENEEMERKWRENEEIERKWRENEEMERDFLFLLCNYFTTTLK